MGELGREFAGGTAEVLPDLIRAYADEWFAVWPSGSFSSAGA